MSRFLNRDLDGNYEGPWPPYPGMYPVSFLGLDGSPMLSILIWDKDASQKRITKDLERSVAFSSSTVVPLFWGSADEIADIAAEAVAQRKVLLVDLIGTKRSTQRAFKRAWEERDLPILPIDVE